MNERFSYRHLCDILDSLDYKTFEVLKQAWWHAPVVPSTREAEPDGLLEFLRQGD
uniref:Uncharacterized protein n=1 Tax=Amazona collaria TaxID=241587 RepID=A0A8B9J096_9PSIT